MYKVISSFADIQDNRHIYKAGDVFPRKGLKVSDERIAELSSDKNRRGFPLIEMENTPLVPDKGSNPQLDTSVEKISNKEVKTQNSPRDKAKSTGRKKSNSKTTSRKAAQKNAD